MMMTIVIGHTVTHSQSHCCKIINHILAVVIAEWKLQILPHCQSVMTCEYHHETMKIIYAST